MKDSLSVVPIGEREKTVATAKYSIEKVERTSFWGPRTEIVAQKI